MAWVQLQRSTEASWDDYEKVSRQLGDAVPAGLIVHAAGEEDGHWRSVSVWESKADYERFRDERLMPAVIEVFGQEAVNAGPPPEESFETKEILKP